MGINKGLVFTSDSQPAAASVGAVNYKFTRLNSSSGIVVYNLFLSVVIGLFLKACLHPLVSFFQFSLAEISASLCRRHWL